jgi:hypothetical protein
VSCWLDAASVADAQRKRGAVYHSPTLPAGSRSTCPPMRGMLNHARSIKPLPPQLDRGAFVGCTTSTLHKHSWVLQYGSENACEAAWPCLELCSYTLFRSLLQHRTGHPNRPQNPTNYPTNRPEVISLRKCCKRYRYQDQLDKRRNNGNLQHSIDQIDLCCSMYTSIHIRELS